MNPFKREPSAEMLRMIESMGPMGPQGFPGPGGAGFDPAGFDPMNIPADFIPLAEFQAAYLMAKELGIYEEQKVLGEYIKRRVTQLAQQALKQPIPRDA